ncbi:MAG: hypothetical protein CL610_21175 [Anaerolineaceae bacterium]|nr:hypothetical protein [Anaerolineaceae bacterium]
MSNQSDVIVKIDDRLRLMSAVLAATNWPDQAQKRQPHGTHAHARATRKFLHEHTQHPAVQSLQKLLDSGAPLEALFTFALCLGWPGLELQIDILPDWVPPRWIMELRDFYRVTNLADWWQDEDAAWQKSLHESRLMLQNTAFKSFLRPFIGEVHEDLVFVPNISYPTDREIGLRIGHELLCITAPRLAWGDSPPWPFDEDPAHVYRAALSQFGRLLIVGYLRRHADAMATITQNPIPVSEEFGTQYTTWEEQFAALWVAAAVAIYLEDYVSQAEAKAYVLMARKAQGMTILPGTISVLRRYINEREAGRYQDLLDFLPIFPKQLRIAKRIMTL